MLSSRVGRPACLFAVARGPALPATRSARADLAIPPPKLRNTTRRDVRAPGTRPLHHDRQCDAVGTTICLRVRCSPKSRPICRPPERDVSLPVQLHALSHRPSSKPVSVLLSRLGVGAPVMGARRFKAPSYRAQALLKSIVLPCCCAHAQNAKSCCTQKRLVYSGQVLHGQGLHVQFAACSKG